VTSARSLRAEAAAEAEKSTNDDENHGVFGRRIAVNHACDKNLAKERENQRPH